MDSSVKVSRRRFAEEGREGLKKASNGHRPISSKWERRALPNPSLEKPTGSVENEVEEEEKKEAYVSEGT